ncbi:MAG TPA: cysteine methyltransferase [Planctomycetaceae bacterium]|nr:cysteine methyltransferase [Planctomycetaceae bacterium]
MYSEILQTPIGDLSIFALDEAVERIVFDTPIDSPVPNDLTRDCSQQLSEYFARQRREFDLPLRFGGTEFQTIAWKALLDIPYGKTSTYSRQASAIGRPKAIRAVGAANGKNVLNIVVPCHRVIGASGSLTGYGGGLERKRWLLDHETQSLFA